MQLLISTYIQTLKERNELDILLPDLLNAMGIIPISRPQTGTRQYGVDLAAVGPDPELDGQIKLYLFVVKQGDIGRQAWLSDSPQSVRPSLDEVFEVYLRSHVPPSYSKLPIEVILCTSGELKEEVVGTWVGYASHREKEGNLVFWGADKLSSLVERYLLNEHLFPTDVRQDFRRTLSLIADNDYDCSHFWRILNRVLSVGSAAKSRDIQGALVRSNLATRVVAQWSQNEGNCRQSLLVTERNALWCFHCIAQLPPKRQKAQLKGVEASWATYSNAAEQFLLKIRPHSTVLHGLSVYWGDSSVGSVRLFELIGFIASIGLAHFYREGPNQEYPGFHLSQMALGILKGVIKNNPASGSPPFDSNVIDICLALAFLKLMGAEQEASEWLHELVRRFQFTMLRHQRFPVSGDADEDLIFSLNGVSEPDEFKELTNTSWLMASYAAWSIVFDMPELYHSLRVRGEEDWQHMTPQYWHRSVGDNLRYYLEPVLDAGSTEAPVTLPEDIEKFRERMLKLLSMEQFDVVESSLAYEHGYFGLDFVASRHFRAPVPAHYWFRFLDRKRDEGVASQETVPSERVMDAVSARMWVSLPALMPCFSSNLRN